MSMPKLRQNILRWAISLNTHKQLFCSLIILAVCLSLIKTSFIRRISDKFNIKCLTIQKFEAKNWAVLSQLISI